MGSQRDKLSEIVNDLGLYIDQYCKTQGGASDPSGEKCNDAYLLLQDALNGLGSDRS